MRKPILMLALFSVCHYLVFFGFPAGGWGELTADLDRGQKIYDQYCLECHGESGRGDGPRAPLLSPRPGNLVSAATSTKSDAELLHVISNGMPRTAMRGWKDMLTEEDRLNVLAFIRSLVRFQEPSLTPPPPK